MRKLAKVLLAGVAALSLTACGQAEGGRADDQAG